MDGKESGKKIPLPGFLRKFSMDRRLQAVCLAVAAAAGVLFFLHMYSMRYVSTLEYDTMAITDQNVFQSLLQGTAEEGDTIWMETFSADEAIYRRGNSYFAGSSYRKIVAEAPLYVNDGNYLLLISGGHTMIMEDWLEEDAAAGSYISDGTVFNFDGSETGDDTVLFLRLGNGAFVNTKALYLEGQASAVTIPANSLLHITEDGISYYARSQGAKLLYGSFTQTFSAKVSMEGWKLTYEEFLIKLGILKEGQEQETDEKKPEEEPEEEPVLPDEPNPTDDGSNPGADTEETNLREDEEREEGDGSRKDAGDGSEGAESAGDAGSSTGSASGNSSAGSAGSNGSTGGSSAGSAGGSSGSAGSAGGSSGSAGSEAGSTGESGESMGSEAGSTGETGENTGGSGGSTGESGGNTGETGGNTGSSGENTGNGAGGNGGSSDTEGKPGDGTGTGGEGEGGGTGTGDADSEVTLPEIPWEKPKVAVTSVEADVYSGTAFLDVKDPAGVFNRVALAFAWDTSGGTPGPDTPVQYRKVLRQGGSFSFDNIPPGTKVYVEAFLQYFGKDGKKIKEEEPFTHFVFETKPFSKVDTICVQFDDTDQEGRYYYENQMSTYDLVISGANGYLVDKVYRGTLSVYAKGESDPTVFSIPAGTLKKYKYTKQLYQSMLSQFSLKPNTEYRYSIQLYDRYGNSFGDGKKICWGYTDQTTPGDYLKATGYASGGTLYEPKGGWKPELLLGSGRFWGYTHTCKTKPAAALIQQEIRDKQVTLMQADLTIRIEDVHQALQELREEDASIGGTAPVKNGTSYKLYYELFAAEHETEPLAVAMTPGAGTDGGVEIRIPEEGETGDFHTRYYLDSDSLSNGNRIYSVKGLTAGKTYSIRVYAQYDLQDRMGTVEKEIGSIRFSATSMASYGRMYYTFTSQHIYTDQPEVASYDHSKYQSATAQQIRMSINTGRTNPTLAKEYFHHFTISFRDRNTSTELLGLEFYRNREQQAGIPSLTRTISFGADEVDPEDGSYTYVLTGRETGAADAALADYTYSWSGNSEKLHQLPEITLRIPDVAAYVNRGLITDNADGTYQCDLWQVFLAVITESTPEGEADAFLGQQSALVLTFDDGYLKSYTNYSLSVESYAAQGAVQDHLVTATSSSYRQVNFTTLKEMPYVTIGGLLQVGRYLYLEDIELHDPDQSIYDKAVTVRNGSRNTGTVNEDFTLDYSKGDGWIEKVTFSGLRLGTGYQLDIIPLDIRRTGRTSQPRIQNTSLYTNSYTAGQGVTGEIILTGNTYSLAGYASADEKKSLNDYDKYEIGNFQYGQPEIMDGAVTYSNVNSSNYTMDPIAVTPGQVYYFHDLTTEGSTRLVLLDADKNPLGGTYRVIEDDSYIRIPEGVSYIQASMYGYATVNKRSYVYSCARAQVLLVQEAGDSLLERYEIVSGRKEARDDGSFLFEEEELREKDRLAVVNSEWAPGKSSRYTLTYTIERLDGTVDTGTMTGYAGFSLPLGENAVKVTASVTALEGFSGEPAEPDVRLINSKNLDIFEDYDTDFLLAGYRAEVRDNNGSLTGSSSGQVRVTVSAVRDGAAAEKPANADLAGQVSDGSYSGKQNFQAETGCTYTMSLEVQWRGRWYPLDAQSFDSNGSQRTIDRPTQLVKMITWPSGEFVVTADLGTIDDRTLSLTSNHSFSGSLDGQGHTLDLELTRIGTWLSSLGSSGVLENLSMKVRTAAQEATLYRYPIGTNNGTIRNVVVEFSTGVKNVRRIETAGLCRFNTGTIENFALYYWNESTTAGTYASSSVGGLCGWNRGIIRNGVVYNARTIDVNTAVWGGSDQVSSGNVGGVAAINESGALIENIIAVLSMRVERNANVPTRDSRISTCGLLVGSNSGMIRNCFTNGEVSYGYWEGSQVAGYQLKYLSGNGNISWPGSNTQGSSYTRNCYYFAAGEYLKNDNYTKFMNSTSVLHAAEFYNGTVNSSGAFVVENQLAGDFYPIVDMPDCMDGRQMNISLNAGSFGNRPTYVGASVKKAEDGSELIFWENQELDAVQAAELKALLADQWESFAEEREDGTAQVKRQFALVYLTFSNRGQYLIDDIQVRALTTRILGVTEGNNISTVTALLTPYLENADGELMLSSQAESFGNAFQLESFAFGYSQQSMMVTAAEDTIDLKFYYPLSYATWRNAPISSSQKLVNYRLIEDIRFGTNHGFADAQGNPDNALKNRALQFFNASNYCANYGGNFDGGGYTMDFAGDENLNSGSYFFRILRGGSVKNLYVKNLLVKEGYTYAGFFGVLDANAEVSDVHLTDVEIRNASQYAGALAGTESSAVIQNCTAAGVTITSGSGASNLYAGGLVGYMTYGSIRNCFVRELKMDTTRGISVKGSGGLVGRVNSNSSWSFAMLSACYAQGTISTSFANAGGVWGYGSGIISQIWTAVDIYGAKNIGAAIGTEYDGNSSINALVVSGELYSGNETIASRLVGYHMLNTTNPQKSYAYSGQLLNSETSEDVMDATGLKSARELSSLYFWQEELGFGRNYCLTGAEGIRGVADGVYPILKNYEGTDLLPQQTEVAFEVQLPEFTVEKATAEEIPISDQEPYGSYDLELTFRVGETAGMTPSELLTALKERVSADGLELSASGVSWSIEEHPEGGYRIIVKDFAASKRLDSYRLDYQFDDSHRMSSKLIFTDPQGSTEVPLYWQLDSADKWNRIMSDHGMQYENFRICADLDFRGKQILANLKVNRLVGAREPASYSNRSRSFYTAPEYYQVANLNATLYTPWIYEISSELSRLDFRDIVLYADDSVNNFGIVGSLVGTAEYLDFANVTLKVGNGTGSYSYLGCIAYSITPIQNCRLADIKIMPGTGLRYYSYVGGLTGSAQQLDSVYAFGSTAGAYSIDMGDSNTAIARSYTGGVVGFIQKTADQIYVENVTVTGRDYTGGAVGYYYQGASKGAFTEEPSIQVVSSTVTGRNQVGGVAGYILYSSYSLRAVDCTVRAYQSYAGGVVGYQQYSGLNYGEAYSCKVTADENCAGGIGGYAFNQSYFRNCKVYGCTIETGGDYAGGILGYSGNSLYNNSVSDSVIKGAKEVGGIVGRLVNTLEAGGNNSIYHNVVSGATEITGENNVGGLVGGACGTQIYYNEVTDTVQVIGIRQAAGGAAGYLSGSVCHHNILAPRINGVARVGGLTGQVLGYGVAYSAGSGMKNCVASAYCNIIASPSIKASGNYVAGLIGLFEEGSEPVDGDGNVIENSGYKDYMSSENFYGNVIVADSITGVDHRNVTWYANYLDSGVIYDSKLSSHGETQRYDAFNREWNIRKENGSDTTVWQLDIPANQTAAAVALKENAPVDVDASALKNPSFYTTALSSGGLDFSTALVDLSDVNKTPVAYYPYIRMYSLSSMLVPYQTTATDTYNWNTWQTRNNVKQAFNGNGISILAATTFNMRSIAQSMVYTSGIDTINIDFSHISTSLVTFEIEGYLEETSIETLEESAWVCSLTYDFATDFDVVLYSADHSVEERFSWRADQLRSTIMTWNGNNYYIRSDGVYLVDPSDTGSSTRVLEGDFVHLYEGKALGRDSSVTELPGRAAAAVSAETEENGE